MDLLIRVQDSEAPFLLELLNKFDFVKIEENESASLLESLETSVRQMQDIRAGKAPKPSIEELFE